MNRWSACALVGVIYWMFALTGLGFVTVIHGECSGDLICSAEKQRITHIGLMVVGLVFPIVIGVVFKLNSMGKK